MRASQTLPEGFVLGGTLRLAGDRRMKTKLTLLGVPWMVLAVIVNVALAALVRPGDLTFAPGDMPMPLLFLALVGGPFLAYAVAIVLHEASHGLVLWLHTGARPVFGFKGWYFYTDLPGWYVSRGPMLMTLVAPLLLVPAIGLPLVAWGPPALCLLAFCGLIVNFAVAIGDVYMIVFALRLPGPVIFGDEGGPAGEQGSWYVLADSRDVEAV